MAQCTPTVHGNGGIPGTNGFVNDFVRWDPDGPGPLGEHIVVVGEFSVLADEEVGGIGMYDPATDTWSRLADCDGTVYCVLATQNGDLLIGGEFQTVNGVAAQHVARFDGTNWNSLGSGIDGWQAYVLSIVELPSGDLIVGGRMQTAGGVPALGLARWDGSNWFSAGDALAQGSAPSGLITKMAVLPNGDLFVAGSFTQIGGVGANNIARFDGSSWLAFGSGLTFNVSPGTVSDVAIAANGDLVIVGQFTDVDGLAVLGVARWDGSIWSAIGAPPFGYRNAVLVKDNGDILVASNNMAVGPLPTPVVRWNGSSWQPMGFETAQNVRALVEIPGGDVLAAGGLAPGGLARWTGGAWQPASIGTDGPVTDVATLADGGYLAVGEFSTLAGVATYAGSTFDGTSWQPWPTTPNPARFSLAKELADGRLVTVTPGSGPPNNYPKMTLWGEATSQVIASTISAEVKAIEVGDDNVIFAGGEFSAIGGMTITALAQWDSGWSAVDPTFTGTVTALQLLPDGRLAVGGDLSTTSGSLGNLAIWDGLSWDTLQGGVSAAPTALAVLASGELVAAGPFQMAGGQSAVGIAIWNGLTWQALGSGIAATSPGEGPLALGALPNGDLLVGGRFDLAGGVAAQNLARWDAAMWHPVGSGASGAVRAIDTATDGRVILAGDFVTIDGVVSAYVCQLEASCPALTLNYGSVFCLQDGIKPTLTVETPAWSGGTLHTRASNLPDPAIAVSVFGLQPTVVVLPSILPQGLPGCGLYMTPDFVSVATSSSGSAAVSLTLPRNSMLVGQTIYHEVLSFGLTQALAIESVASTNAIAMTIGAMW